MAQTGMVRRIDKLGRVVIPKELRKLLDVQNEVDSFEIFVEDDSIVLKKYRPHCIFCESKEDCLTFGGNLVCRNCIDKLKVLDSEQPPRE